MVTFDADSPCNSKFHFDSIMDNGYPLFISEDDPGIFLYYDVTTCNLIVNFFLEGGYTCSFTAEGQTTSQGNYIMHL